MSIQKAHLGGTIGEMILQSIARYPERTALIDEHSQLTYRDLGLRIGQAMAAFLALDLRRGDGVVQLSGNRNDMFIVMAAAYILGLRSVTLHGMGGLDDHSHIVDDAEARLFISESGYRQRLDQLRSRCKNVQHWYSHDDGIPDQESFWSFATRLAPAPLQVSAQDGDIIRLAYTGGTTGRPKGVMLSNRSMWMQALLLLAARNLPDEIRLLCPTPISHGAGAMLVPTLYRGGTIILQRGFNPEQYLAALEQYRATVSFLVPTMLYTLLDHPRTQHTDLSSLQLLSYGAAPMAPARIDETLALLGPILVQSYGQTECPSNILCLSQSDHARKDIDVRSSAGMPYPGVTISLRDEHDQEVPEGETGELCVRSPLVMEGYWKQAELTAETLRGGWLHTGDMAYRDANGYYFLVDRKKDMIISGGFNVYPKEIENLLSAHPAIAAAAVIGVPDDKWGEAVKAIVVLREGATATADELRSIIRAAKGPVNTPKTVDFVSALPLTALGKPDKNLLRKQFWASGQRAIH